MELRSALPTALAVGVFAGVTLAGLGRPTLTASAEPVAEPVAIVPAEVAPVTFDLPVVWNESVERFVNLFHHQQTDRMALYLKRGGRYEGMIRSKLRERGMPQDLIYLSMIESGFNPNARSKAQAVGLWQFMAATGRNYGLRVDGYVDERRDPEKSTDAALRYLQDLHRQFGSWNLAAAAYNTGENRVARIMREETGSERGQESDFWRIRSRLPRDTREYVPLIYAAAVVGKEPEKYGLTAAQRWLPVETDTVTVPGRVDLSRVASAVGVTEEEIRKLNPALIGGATPPGDGYAVRVPDGRAPEFVRNFRDQPARAAAPPAADRAKAKTTRAKSAAARHQVRSGESLWTIAQRHGTSVVALQRANGLGRRSVIRPGQMLRIPA